MSDTEAGDSEKVSGYLLQASFKVGNALYDVTLSEDSLKWLKKDDPTEKAGLIIN